MRGKSASAYVTRCVVMAGRGSALNGANAFAPVQREDLVFRGGRTLPRLSFKLFYLGKQWADPHPAADRENLDAALAAAMSDPGLNDIVDQYFGDVPVSTVALPSSIVDLPVQTRYDKGDIHGLAQRLFMSGALSGMDLTTCILSFVLPPGAVLSSDGGGEEKRGPRHPAPGTPDAEEADSKHGLGGYHGSIHLPHPGTPTTLYYAVSVWSNGDNGIAIPGWESWENACATFYHELNEARTDPDVEDAIRTGDLRWIGWNSNSGSEIGDFPISEAGADLTTVFKRVPVADPPGTVPIQLMWSNRVHGPEAPASIDAAIVRAAPLTSAMLVIGTPSAAAAATGAGIDFSAPGNLADFKSPTSAARWSTLLSGLFDSALAGTQAHLKGLPSQFFNPAAGRPAGAPTEQPIKWPAFPRLLENSDLPPDEQLRQAELISGTFIGRLQHQDEYLEWFVTRDAQSQKITRIDFTCEGPEYWEFLAEEEPKVLLDLYKRHVSPIVKASDLVTAGKYNRLNVWNTRGGAMHLIQPANSLNAEIKITADATILRKNADGSLKTDAQDLILCGRYGEPGRASDPHIGDLVNGLARNGYVVSLKDPVGLYMSRPRLAGFTTPDGTALTPDWFKVTRGSEDHILRGVFAAPAGTPFVVGDVLIGGVPIAFGGQVAKAIDMGLTGVAYGKGSITSPSFPCEIANAAVLARLNSRSVGRLS